MTTAYPLAWPDGWKRTFRREDDRRFRGRTYGLTIGRARDRLLAELRQLGAKSVVISSNLRLRQDGLPYSDQRRLDDPGIAVYFLFRKRPMVMATDRFVSVEGNMTSLALAIDAMRQLDRHGGGAMMERAFAGFVAIAPPNWKKPWREVIGLKRDWQGDLSTVASLYRTKARERHPDGGGSDTLMAELNVAYAEAKAELEDAGASNDGDRRR